MPSGSARAMALALAAAATAEASAFMMPSGGGALRQGRARPAVAAGRPALRSGAGAVRAVYEPAIRIGHGFDIHRLGVCVCVCVCALCALCALCSLCASARSACDAERCRSAVGEGLPVADGERCRGQPRRTWRDRAVSSVV